MAVRRWNQSVDGPFTEAALRDKLEAMGYRAARYAHHPGTGSPHHTPGIHGGMAVVSGRFRLVVSGHLAVLGPGDWVVVPRGSVHSAAVMGDEPVVSLDAVKL